MTTSQGKKLRKIKDGVVVSNKMPKTLVVAVVRRLKHPKYGKFISLTKKYHAHDETGMAKLGDLVRIVESRPLSSLKRWRLKEVLNSAKQ
ncbi:MAG TPA: 30S ribosomal protein S17 [Oligoflexia bacterium]|nr:30S ribosomal protein S17 [Oligoflexia bacterium]HMP26489.1 30S ribosomal protein S17 [Oligoflexia bacterium]